MAWLLPIFFCLILTFSSIYSKFQEGMFPDCQRMDKSKACVTGFVCCICGPVQCKTDKDCSSPGHLCTKRGICYPYRKKFAHKEQEEISEEESLENANVACIHDVQCVNGAYCFMGECIQKEISQDSSENKNITCKYDVQCKGAYCFKGECIKRDTTAIQVNIQEGEERLLCACTCWYVPKTPPACVPYLKDCTHDGDCHRNSFCMENKKCIPLEIPTDDEPTTTIST